MYSLLQQIASGIAMGGIYACLGLALVMIYQSTHHINFAQGEMAMFSTFIAFLLLKWGLPYWAAALATLAFGFVAGFAIERLVLRPLGDVPELSVIVVFIGLFVGINSLAGWIFGHQLEPFPSPFPDKLPGGSTLISGHELGTVAVVLLVMALLYAFLRFTKVGLAMRASAENPVSSRLAGIPVSLMLSLGWGLSALIGAVAGLMVAPVVFLEPNMMGGVLIYAFAAALLGGIDNPWGAVAGGLIVGVVENLAGTYLVGTELKLTLALVLIVAVLLVRPSGLFGRKLVARV
ncbi:ABC transporter permease [Variovorax paradoxus]|jgi:branched-chain amino acid transport system permease protein|uniref:branched-chain amino acid ABC transporter permease n=1 Tax=Variovorax TaxID=34072 RepID=UPI0006E6CFF9|nr:branched-chain amino acid ABC transporter permease [Variovorax sp.]KPV00125.1 ABC transporter permease [Variovorax paradoxus]KAF1061465.1 MAG: High-affinity branched-chain amino acid transport system permease protein LivH [Variovorax sp.]KPV07303.1 ABC transporter permease [Variovorax paradoxus]KPV12413.1 ABC transporter permease [Variovorax paradoxus]KPV19095.1 ABC transporter permease [Variovorax paradoxus]